MARKKRKLPTPPTEASEPEAAQAGAEQKAPPVVLVGEIVRLGKDEMNLAEHPFAALWKNTSKESVLYYEWERPHSTTGKPVKASWRVMGDSELGLPTALDEQVYLVLMELTREAGFTQTVHFTRYDLLKRLGWTDSGKSNDMLRDSFARLTGVTVTAENSFWSPRAKQFGSASFHILDNTEFLNEPPGLKSADAPAPMSFFKWNDVLFQSFVDGNIRSLDLSVALALHGSIALRLFRFLDKKTYSGQHPFEISLRDLCELHLGMAVEDCYESNLKAKLKPAHEELTAIGFLKEVRYEPMKTRDGSKVCYVFPRKKTLDVAGEPAPRATLPALEAAAPDSASVPVAPPAPVAAPVEAQGAPSLLQRMLALKVSRHVAQGLLESTSAEQLELQLDCLEDREPRNPAAIFVKAVREGWEAPCKYLERVEAQERAKKAQTTTESDQALKAAQRAATGLLRASQELEESQLDVLWEQMPPEAREKLDDQVRERLGVLGRTGRAQGALKAMRRNLMREQGLQDPGATPSESES